MTKAIINDLSQIELKKKCPAVPLDIGRHNNITKLVVSVCVAWSRQFFFRLKFFFIVGKSCLHSPQTDCQMGIQLAMCNIPKRTVSTWKVTEFILQLYLVEIVVSILSKNKVSAAGQNQILHLNCIAIFERSMLFLSTKEISRRISKF